MDRRPGRRALPHRRVRLHQAAGDQGHPRGDGGEEQLEIKVTGRQFYWQYEYPNGVIAIDHDARAGRRARAPRGHRARRRTSSTRGGSPRSAARSTRSRASPTTRGSRRRRQGPTRASARSCAVSSTRRCSRRSRSCPPTSSLPGSTSATREQSELTELGKEEWEGVCAKCHGLERRGRHRPAHRRLAARSPTRRRSRTSSATAAARCPRSARAGPTSRSTALADYLKESPPSGS